MFNPLCLKNFAVKEDDVQRFPNEEMSDRITPETKDSKSINYCCPMSGKWDLNPRPSAWEADALPTELLPHLCAKV